MHNKGDDGKQDILEGTVNVLPSQQQLFYAANQDLLHHDTTSLAKGLMGCY